MPVDSPAATAIVDDAMTCAAQLQSLGEEIDGFRRKGGAALGGEPGPELEVLQLRQDELVRNFLERALQVERDDRAALGQAHQRLREMYERDRHDLVTGRALELVEASLRRDAH